MSEGVFVFHFSKFFMPSAEFLRFQQEVIEPFRVRDRNGAEHSYAAYLGLNPALRAGDEAAVIDNVFARSVLAWLGFTEAAHSTYNLTQVGQRANRPDFVVHAPVGTAFVWESKGTTENWSEAEFAAQLRRYVAGTAGYAVWCNARTLVALRFDPNGRSSILAEVPLESLFGVQPMLPELRAASEDALQLFHLLFRRERFTTFDALLDKVCVDEATFLANAISLEGEGAQQRFVGDSLQVLEHLKLAALARARAGLESRKRLENGLGALRTRWKDTGDEFIARLPVQLVIGEAPTTPWSLAKAELVPILEQMGARLGDLEPDAFAEVESTLRLHVTAIPTAVMTALKAWHSSAARINTAASAVRFYAGGEPGIADAFGLWAQKQTDEKLATAEIFAEQAAYVFFVRILLARVLEDKGLLEQRIVSDGGFDAWRKLVSYYAGEGPLNLHTQPFVYLLSARVSRYYQHFFQQPVFDWFLPDDLLLLETLEFLGRYHFGQVNSDIIGFTYENYTNRVARNKKGHFLTQPRVVEYMLDLLGYAGSEIIGAKLLDPACGSGSFLVHAAGRYRAALQESPFYRDKPLEQARAFIEALTTLLHGMEINPFSCYLAELNLLVCGLGEMHALWQAGESTAIDRFLIYNTDSLEMPRPVLASTSTQNRTGQIPYSLEDALLDESYALKARREPFEAGFGFVVSNPPYVTPKQHQFERDYRSYPFFGEMLSGDTNMYLLFLRLGLYYLAQGGKMSFIVPLTVLGDGAADAARKMMATEEFSPTTLVRFFTGNVLFPGIDQATAILVVARGAQSETVRVGGGLDVGDAQTSLREERASRVLRNTPQVEGWAAPWLVSAGQEPYAVWEHVAGRQAGYLRELWSGVLEPRQGDVNSTHVNVLRIGNSQARQSGDVAIYKGENVFRFAPLPLQPSDWARPRADAIGGVDAALRRIGSLENPERGFVYREIARLNTRETLLATWFERDASAPLAFTHEVWRFRLLDDAAEERAKALLALINSRVVSFLLNLFSTNNHVLLSETGRILIPALSEFPQNDLASLTNALLQTRRTLESSYITALGAKLPETSVGDGVTLAAEAVLSQSGWPTISLLNYRQRGVLTLPANAARVGTTLNGNRWEVAEAATETMLRLFLASHSEKHWNDVADLRLPEPTSAASFVAHYEANAKAAQALWDEFRLRQREVDEVVANWYGFDTSMREAIQNGLPWARRRSG